MCCITNTRDLVDTMQHWNSRKHSRIQDKIEIEIEIWFNPPFSINVKTNIGKGFFKLIRKLFPRNHSFSKIFNLDTIKISYSSMKMKNLMKQHNARVLKNQEHSEKRSCNCRIKDNFPLDGKCLHECIVYQANVLTNNECK